MTISASGVKLQNMFVTNFNNVNDPITGAGKAITINGTGLTGIELNGVRTERNGTSLNNNSGGNGAIGVTGTNNTVTIKNGSSSCNEPSGLYGGGLSVTGTGNTVNIDNMNFNKNSKTGLNGGAISVTSASTVNITNSRFEGNQAVNGGAIFVSDLGVVNVSNTLFKGNIATQTSSIANGGAIAVGRRGTLTVTNSTFDSLVLYDSIVSQIFWV